MSEPATGVEIIGHVYGVDGFSCTNTELAMAIHDKGFPVKLTPLHHKQNISCPMNYPKDIELKINSIVQAPITSRMVSVHHYSIQGIRFFNGAALGSVYYGVYETDQYPLVWKYMIQRAHMFKEIWTPSSFNMKTLESIGVPLYQIPHGINLQRFNPNGPKLQIDGTAGFNFLSCMTWKKLKGYDLLLQAYCEEFASGKDDVALILKAYMGSGNIQFEKQQMMEYIHEIKSKRNSKARILLIADSLNYEDMPSLYRSADCFVLPTRGEGWGKNLMEAMASNLPCIVTEGSGHMDYINKDNSLLIKSQQKEIDDIEWLLKEPVAAGHKWFEPSLEDLKKQMRWAYEHKLSLLKLGDKARESVQKYDWPIIADQFIKLAQDFGVRNGK